jgi:hypothetical protein
MTLNLMKAPKSSGSGVFPALVMVQGNEQKNVVLNRTPFSVGRKVDKDLVIADPRVSRDHALIVLEEDGFYLVDQGSKHGTFVNGERVQRQKLERNDRLEFGARDSSYAIFNPAHGTSNTARDFLSQISGIQISQETTDLEKLTLFLEAARKLNTAGVLDEILMTMLEVTLRLTRAERGYVFLTKKAGCGWRQGATARANHYSTIKRSRTRRWMSRCGRIRNFCLPTPEVRWTLRRGRASSPTIFGQ